jgi:putative tryptophan/tyrosine transport system substrate-binding protein
MKRMDVGAKAARTTCGLEAREHREVTRRSFMIGLAVLGCALPVVPSAQQAQSARVRRIGLVVGDDPEGLEAAFRETLRNRGYIEGQNLLIEARYSQRSPSGTNVAVDLVNMDLELVVVASLPSALVAQKANPSMPLVIVTTPGIVSNGFAQSIERPGGSATGIDELPPGVTATRLELLKTAAPAVSRVALLSTTPGRGGHEAQLADAEDAAARLGVTVKPYRATTVAELKQALAAIGADGMNGLMTFQGGLSFVNRQLIVDFAATQRMPGMYQATVFATAGGLMTWAPNLVDQYRAAADYVDQILKGAKAGDLPIRYPARYYLTLNDTTARNLGLTFPPALLSKADRVLP